MIRLGDYFVQKAQQSTFPNKTNLYYQAAYEVYNIYKTDPELMTYMAQFHFDGLFFNRSYSIGMNLINEAIDRVWDRNLEYSHLFPLYLTKAWFLIKSIM